MGGRLHGGSSGESWPVSRWKGKSLPLFTTSSSAAGDNAAENVFCSGTWSTENGYLVHIYVLQYLEKSREQGRRLQEREILAWRELAPLL